MKKVGYFLVRHYKKIIAGVLAGDLNSDGEFNISDAVLLQKWLLGLSDNKLVNWKAADFCNDDKIDIFDLVMMKKELIRKF